MANTKTNIGGSNRQSLAIAALGAWCFTHLIAPAHAFHYIRAAQRDERTGFVYTAALDWRHAAELLAPYSPLAEIAWQQWERIMHLPRRLAEPIGIAQAISPEPRISASPRTMGMTLTQPALAA